MPKYRLLNQEELEELQTHFVKYLVLNGITGSDWEKMKTETPDEAKKIMDLFSDVVFEKVLRKIDFIDRIEEKAIYCFQCLEKEIVLVGIKTNDDSLNFIEQLPKEEDYAKLQVFTKTKEYIKERQSEIFDMLENGCSISEGELFKKLSILL